MRAIFKIQRALLEAIHTDLSRSHTFSYERVGFISCRTARLKDGLAVLAQDYHPVADDDYEDGYEVGAMMAAGAIRKALQIAYNQPATMIHVHRHDHCGTPKFSKVDLTESAKFVPDFWKVRSDAPHGILVLSYDSMFGLFWNPITRQSEAFDELSVVGRPLDIFRYDNAKTSGKTKLSRH